MTDGDVTVGKSADTHARIVVTDAGSRLTINGGMALAVDNSLAAVTVSNGGLLETSGLVTVGNVRTDSLLHGSGILVDGGDWDVGGHSVILSMGQDGSGRLDIRNGGKVLDIDRLTVARREVDANVELRNGGVLQASDVVLGGEAETVKTVETRRSCYQRSFFGGRRCVEWEETVFETIGGSGEGFMFADGLGTTVVVDDMLIGEGGSGVLDVWNSAVVNVANHLNVHDNGVINLNGGSINIGDITSPANSNAIHVGPGGVLSGTGTINGDIINQGGGVHVPGHSPGLMTVNGDYVLGADSFLVIEVEGISAGQFDVLNILGDANFSGDIVFDFSYAPQAGDSFDFLSVAGLLTNNVTFGFAGLEDDFQFDTSFDGTTLSMMALSDGQMIVPEPSAWAMAGIGVVAFAFFACRRRRV